MQRTEGGTTRAIGRRGEETAARFLLEKRYDIVARNFLVRGGEIDIIAWHDKPHFGKTLCFIEVKTREANDGSAERATGFKKQQHFFFAAKAFCAKHRIPIESTPIQFEQVSVYLEPEKIRHFIIPVN